MNVNNGNSQNLPDGWKPRNIPTSTRFSHETDSAENVLSIIREGIKNIGNGSLGRGLYASVYNGHPMELESGYMIVFRPADILNGFDVTLYDYAMGNIEDCAEKAEVHEKYDKYLNASDFYGVPRTTEYVFHSSAKIIIDKIVDISTGKEYTTDEFLSIFGK